MVLSLMSSPEKWTVVSSTFLDSPLARVNEEPYPQCTSVAGFPHCRPPHGGATAPLRNALFAIQEPRASESPQGHGRFRWDSGKYVMSPETLEHILRIAPNSEVFDRLV